MNILGALIIVGFGIHVSLRMRARDPKDALMGVAAYYVTFYLVILFGGTILPKQIVSTEQKVDENWGVVFDRAADAGGTVGQTLYEYTGLGDVDASVPTAVPVETALVTIADVPATPEPTAVAVASELHTVESGDTLDRLAARYGVLTSDIRLLNGLTGDLIQVGQKLIIAQPDQPAEPTVTPKVVAVVTPETHAIIAPLTAVPQVGDASEHYNALGVAKYSGDMPEGILLVNLILQINPTDEVTLAEAAHIKTAQEKQASWGDIGKIEGGFTVDEGVSAMVKNALSGYSYEIVDDGAGTFKALCSEFSEIKVTDHGWLFNDRITVPRCYLAEHYNAILSGDTFTAR